MTADYGSTDRPIYANTLYGVPMTEQERQQFRADGHAAIRRIRAELGIDDEPEARP